jgi:phenylpropionate dioxygenase-like ring-hydroxylating dioxygenase large terminal subunit
MDSAIYTQGDAFQAEKRTIFSTCWLPLCAEGQVAEPGQFVSASVGGWSVFAVRGKDGEVRVLRNACRHQNMPVVGTPAGTCETFRCRFHGWTYDLEGKFLSAPPSMPPTGADNNLQELATTIEQGIVFFLMEEGAAKPSLAPLGAYGNTITTDMACNWKIAGEELKAALPDATWHGPLLAVQSGLVHQIVPHTFLRTKLLTHSFGGASPSLESLKQKCEARQVSYGRS